MLYSLRRVKSSRANSDDHLTITFGSRAGRFKHPCIALDGCQRLHQVLRWRNSRHVRTLGASQSCRNGQFAYPSGICELAICELPVSVGLTSLRLTAEGASSWATTLIAMTPRPSPAFFCRQRWHLRLCPLIIRRHSGINMRTWRKNEASSYSRIRVYAEEIYLVRWHGFSYLLLTSSNYTRRSSGDALQLEDDLPSQVSEVQHVLSARCACECCTRCGVVVWNADDGGGFNQFIENMLKIRYKKKTKMLQK